MPIDAKSRVTVESSTLTFIKKEEEKPYLLP
jgi:hypothetical protein